MYSALLVITLAAFVWTGFRTGSCFRVSVQTVFHCFLISFLCVRWVWLALRTFYQTDDESPVTFILNRIAFCLYFTSFLVYGNGCSWSRWSRSTSFRWPS